VFFFRSPDGGASWVGPTRINDDRSVPPADRNEPAPGDFGNDQWFPWIDVDADGVLALAFYDRRLDDDSEASAWPDSRQRPGNYLTWRFGAGCHVTRPDDCDAPGASVMPQPTKPVDPGPGPVPGQGVQYLGRFHNQVLSDVPSNMDYSFRAGLFMGDYDVVAFPNFPQLQDDRRGWNRGGDADEAVASWTDARNGRSSGTPSAAQPGRNPSCEQSDVFLDFFDPLSDDKTDSVSNAEEKLFLVTPCPGPR
jgi:hypothetical protein